MLFIQRLFTNPPYFIAWVIVVVFSICVHEYMHAYAAYTQGDDTAATLGYCTLNPIKLMGIQSLLMLAFMGIAWGAVPVVKRKMRHRWSPMLVAGAGPASNAVLAVLFGIAAAFVGRAGGNQVSDGALLFLRCGLEANALLLVFNMLPIPMLDGWEVYSGLIPQMRSVRMANAQQLSWILIIILFMTPLRGIIWTGADLVAGGIWSAADAVFAVVLPEG